MKHFGFFPRRDPPSVSFHIWAEGNRPEAKGAPTEAATVRRLSDLEALSKSEESCSPGRSYPGGLVTPRTSGALRPPAASSCFSFSTLSVCKEGADLEQRAQGAFEKLDKAGEKLGS